MAGDVRARLIADLGRSRPFGRALARLRDRIRANSFDVFLPSFDRRTRQEGFHALHDWDGKAEEVLGETIPVDVLDYAARMRGDADTSARALAVLLDYYYLHVLSLLALRIWDEGDADANLDRVAALLDRLQGPDGSGQRFVSDAETLILIATSHYEAVELGYDRLLQRVRSLNRAHQARIALGHAASMGCHLRFGFEATYRRDTVSMRDDNVADYPWLCYALFTVIREYERAPSDALVDAMLNGLSADARAFVGVPPASLAGADAERQAFRDAFLARRTELLDRFEARQPVDGAYSPLSFFFNFSHNVLKGIVVDAILRDAPWPVVFNDLLTGGAAADPAGHSDDPRLTLARTLMRYARANPDRINGEPTPVIVYDARAGRRAFRVMMEKLRAPSL